jgi:hypothetical protein
MRKNKNIVLQTIKRYRSETKYSPYMINWNSKEENGGKALG